MEEKNDSYRIFANNLKYFLSLSKITKADLARNIGVATGLISDYCAGMKMPRMDKLKKIAEVLGVTVSDLIEDNSQKQAEGFYTSDEDKRLLNSLRENVRLHQLLDISSKLPQDYIMVLLRTAEELERIGK